jgi:hypothetical protein
MGARGAMQRVSDEAKVLGVFVESSGLFLIPELILAGNGPFSSRDMKTIPRFDAPDGDVYGRCRW